MDFFGILLLTFLGFMTLIYIFKYCINKNQYVVEEEITPEDLEVLQQHINNINNVAVNYNPRNNREQSHHELPPKYEDIQNDPPNYPSSNSS